MSQHHRWNRYDRSRLSNAWNAIDDLREAVDSLYTADEIAAAVSEKIKRDRVVTFTWLQKGAALAVSGAAIATAIHSWVG